MMKKVIFSLVVAATGLAVMAFSLQKPKEKKKGNHKYTYLALGDAYTLGEGVTENERWPIQLENHLRTKKQVHINYPNIIARNTWKCNDLLQRLEEEDATKHYDLVTLQIGVNDQFNKHTPSQFLTDFKKVLAKAAEFTGKRHGRLVVVSIPDWSVTPFAKKHDAAAVSDQIGKYNALIKKEAIAIGAHYVDIVDLSKKAATDPTLLAPDQLHPSGKMYGQWVEQRIAATVIKALETHK